MSLLKSILNMMIYASGSKFFRFGPATRPTRPKRTKEPIPNPADQGLKPPKAKEAKKYYTSKNSDGTIVSYGNQKMTNNVLDSPGNCDLTSHVCIETLINDAETLGFDTVGITKQGEALLALGLAERLYGIQKEFKEDLSNALLRREALLRLVDPVCLGDFKWFVFKKFNEKKMNINPTCLR